MPSPFQTPEDLAAARSDGQRIGDARGERGDAEIEQSVVPIGLELRLGEAARRFSGRTCTK